MAATSFTQFGPDDPLSSLDAQFRGCLGPDLTAAERQRCDAVVGSLASGNGYCANDRYSRMSYCACVNNAIPCPMVAASACANSAFAYRPSAMSPPDGEAYLGCKDATICVNLVEVGGSQNVVSGITQQCGVIQNVRNVIGAYPIFAVILLVLVVCLAMLLVIARDDPPPYGRDA
jgi:hypothetical protein